MADLSYLEIDASKGLTLHKDNVALKPFVYLFDNLLQQDTLSITGVSESVKDAGTTLIQGVSNTWGSAATIITIEYITASGDLSEISISKPIDTFDGLSLFNSNAVPGIAIRNLHRTIFFTSTFADDSLPEFQTAFATEKINGELHFGETFALDFEFDSGRDDQYAIECKIDEQAQPDFAQLSGSFKAHDELAQLPDELKLPVSLKSLRLTVEKNELAEINIILNVLPNVPPWKIITINGQDLLVVKDLWFGLDIDYPLDSNFRFARIAASGTVQIGPDKNNGNLLIAARWPDFAITGELQENNTIAIGDILDHFGVIKTGESGFDQIAITKLSFRAEPVGVNKSFSFFIIIDDIWHFDVDGKPVFEIKELSLSLDYDSGTQTKVTGSIDGKFIIAGIEIDLGASHDASAWNFYGRMGLGQSVNVGDLVKDIAAKFSASEPVIPSQLSVLSITGLGVAFSKLVDKKWSFTFDCGFAYGETAYVNLHFKVDKATTGYAINATGELMIDGKGFDLDFSKPDGGIYSLLKAIFKNLTIDLPTLAANLIADPVIRDIIPPLEISPNYALIFRAKDNANTRYLVGLDLDIVIDMKGMPLVGTMIGGNGFEIRDLQFLYATQNMSAADVQEVQSIAGISVPSSQNTNADPTATQPATGATLAKGLSLKAKVIIGTLANFELNLPAGTKSATANNFSTTSAAATGSNTNATPLLAGTAPAPGEGDIKWLDIQKSLGPVYIGRLGLRFKDKRIQVLVDASLGLGGLVLSLDGLGVSNPLNAFDPQFSLMGLGIDFEEGPIEIEGYFLRTDVGTPGTEDFYTEYSGMALLKIEMFSLSAIGSYANIKGEHSVFIYAVLNFPIGGPAFFFITGIAAGFGFNRALTMPDISGVKNFPLVREVIGGGDSSPVGIGANDRRKYLQQKMELIREVIYPKPGQYFLALGVRFTSFEIIDSFVMVAIQFGHHFELDVLGISSLMYPKEDEGRPLVKIEMAIKIVVNPDEGYFSVEAQLTSDSYLFSQDCHLTGGFAFYVWFGGPHKGDFLITIGGYHPDFDVPKHYPKVPRLGFNWKLSDVLLIKGENYFALTGHAFMAGGLLEVMFHAGGLKAWIIVGADFIISWEPYYYDARIYVEIGVSLTFWLFVTIHIEINLGADMHIWGPDFSGKITIHLWIISFTISFGDAEPKPKPISWPSFKEAFLPGGEQTDGSKIISIVVAAGLLREIKDENSDERISVINPKELTISVNSLIPANTYHFYGDTENQMSVYYADEGRSVLQSIGTAERGYISKNPTTIPGVGVAPMDLASVAVSLMDIKVWKMENGKQESLATEDFAFKPVLKKVPQAMWGSKLTSDVNSESFIENALCGFDMMPASGAIAGETQPVLKSTLQYSVDQIQNVFQYSDTKSFTAGGNDADFDAINASTVVSARQSLLQSYGFENDELMINIPPDIKTMFVRQPRSAVFES